MNRERWREYNKLKQREYRGKHGKPYLGHPYKRIKPYVKVDWEAIFTAEGHCEFCGCLLDSMLHTDSPCDSYLKKYGLD
jgi:hypothetical protein